MQYKGVIGSGTIEATFQSESSNKDPDLLTLGCAESTPSHVRAEAAPGGQASVSLEVAPDGMVQVMVAMGPTTDRGTLTVSSNGSVRDSEAISGSAHWIYTAGPR